MQLQAVSVGEAVPRETFNALVQSVFDSAANLRLVDEGRLITLLLSDHYELPQGIRTRSKTAPFQSLTVGTGAALRGGILRFDASPLKVDLRAAQVWKCPVPELHTNMGFPDSQRAWSTAWQLLNAGQQARNTDLIADHLFRLNIGSSLSQKMSAPVTQLMASAKRGDVQSSVRAAEKLVGLGPGVTPTGDDFLIGLLAGLWSTRGKDQGHGSFIDAFGNALMDIAKQTSEISRTYLFHAVRGQFSSSLSNLSKAIAEGLHVEQAAQEAMQVGHSSGMDSVTGLLIGLTVWSPLQPDKNTGYAYGNFATCD
jgi:hypothetical protein